MEPTIYDFIDVLGTNDDIEINISSASNEYVKGKCVGIDLENNHIKVTINESTSNTGHWLPLYFQLNKNNPKFYKVRLIKK